MFNSIKKNNIKWTIRDNLEENILDNLYLKLKDFASCPDFSIVKDNNVRTVLFLEPGQNTPDRIFVKLYKKGGLFGKIKHFVVPSKAFSEWHNLKHFDKIGLPCPKPLALSEIRYFRLLGESCLLIEAIPSAFPLNEYVENNVLPLGKRRSITTSLAGLIRDLHANNIFYKDLHAGNILISEKTESEFDLFFIDLHRAALPGKISERMRIKDIAQLCNSVLCSNTERQLFLKEYLGERAFDSESLKTFSKKIAGKRDQLEKTRIKSRSKRCLKNSSVFEKKMNSRETYHGRKDFGKKETDEVLALHGLIKKDKDTAIVKVSEKSIITIVDKKGRKPLCVKENRFVSILYTLKNIFRKSRAMRSWIAANRLLVRGVDTPLPFSVVEKKIGPLIFESYFISSFMKDAKEINNYITVFKDPGHKENKTKFIKACADVFKNLHSQGIYHADLKSNNILVTENERDKWKFFFVDLDRVLFKKDISFYQRANNLAQLNASISSLMTVKDRLKFFRFYAKDTQLYTYRKKYYCKILEISKTKITGLYGISFDNTA